MPGNILRGLPVFLYLCAFLGAQVYCLANPSDAFRGIFLVIFGLPWSLIILPLAAVGSGMGSNDLSGSIILVMCCAINAVALFALVLRPGRR